VVVRGTAPSQGYWVVVKDDGAWLYSFLGSGVYHLLVHDATPWITGMSCASRSGRWLRVRPG